ncbi:MAG: L,D-transpeptidase family protein [Methylovirgula sp.]
MPMRSQSSRPYGALAAAALTSALLAGCGETPGGFGDFSERATKPLSPQLTALMQEKGTAPNSPILIRAYKKEAEVEIWKMKPDGHYTMLKSFPICRWSGQLGPKTREGDRQVPEGFYTITPAQMNPRSAYYLSFNVGYPNAFDRAHNYSGGEIMVHGVCSSAGCFSMTNQQMAEIYAIAREAFSGGQQEIQFQSYPFHMTAENLAKYRLDPHIAFWKELKVGNDNFDVSKQEVAVGVCNEHYVFNAQAADGSALDPNGPCPALKHDETIALAVKAKEAKDNAEALKLVAAGEPPVRTVYSDGGQNPQFAGTHKDDVSRPDALAAGPVDMPLEQGKGHKLTAAQLEKAKAKAEAEAAAAERKAEAAHAMAYAEPAPAAPPPKPQQGFNFALPQFGKPAPEQTATAAPAAQPAPQGKPIGIDMGGFGHIFGGGQPQPAPAAQPTNVAAAPTDAAAPADEPTTAPTRVSKPLPPTFVQTAAIRSGKPIVPSEGRTDGKKTVQAKTEKITKVKSGEKTPADVAAAEADAEAAKAAYAKPVGQASSTAMMPYGFSGFTSGDH